MAKRFAQLFVLLAAFCLAGSSLLFAQVTTVGTLIGTVSDPTGAIVVGADVQVRDEATGATVSTKSGTDGHFVVGNLKPGLYTVTVTMAGFRKSENRAVKIVVGGTYDLQVKLEVGAVESTVVVEAGAEVLETASATVSTVVTGKAITQLPFTSRDALDLAMLVPGAQTTGRPRNTTFMGLPKGSINITLDGINAQDNINKSSDGFFTTIRARIDSVEEFSVSTAAGGAEQAAEGAVQMRMTTNRGGNEYHGGLWWYHRNDFLNANYYFNNLDGNPRERLRLNQFGYKVGGPIYKEKLFFFHAFDFYRLPAQRVRTRTVLTDEATLGGFRYIPRFDHDNNPATATVVQLPTAAQLAAAPWVTCQSTPAIECVADVLALAGNFPADTQGNNVRDDFIREMLEDVNSVFGLPGVSEAVSTTLFTRNPVFNNNGVGNRWFPDWRFDWNITNNHQFTFIYHFSNFVSTPDFLNSRDPTFPTARFRSNQFSQNSNRNQFVGAWRWNLAANKSNELRFGVVSAPVWFFNDADPNFYVPSTTNLGAIQTRPVVGLITNPYQAFSRAPRNTALWQLIENFSWTKGKHSMAFGFSMTRIHGGITTLSGAAVHNVSIGLSATDPIFARFTQTASTTSTTTTLPGATTTDQGNARSLYGLLTGRVTAYSGSVFVDTSANAFVTGEPLRERYRQTEFGFYGTDNWRIFPTVTLSYGLRWEYQGSPYATNPVYFRMENGFNDLFGVTGPTSLDNLFTPGRLDGTTGAPFYVNAGKSGWYDRDTNNFAPSVGVAWQPNFDNTLWNMMFGGPGKTVFRAGYAINFTREGTGNWLSMVEGNPGFSGSQTASPVSPAAAAVTPVVPGDGRFIAGSQTYSTLNWNFVRQTPAAFVDRFQLDFLSGFSVNVFKQDLGVPYVQSWSVGVQREITPNMVLEVRYVGNHGTSLWRQINVNETDAFTNGFLDEALVAIRNLNICRANATACTTAQATAGVATASRTANSFANWGITDASGLNLGTQGNLPIMTAAFAGAAHLNPLGPAGTASFGSCNNSTTGNRGGQCFVHSNAGTFLSNLETGTIGTFANSLAGSTTFWPNLVAAGLPPNTFRINPDARGGAFIMMNDTHSSYNGLQVEVRRRMSKGVQFTANYTYSKSLTNMFANSGVSFSSYRSLRDRAADRFPSPWDLKHQFKLQGIWELPFGPGRKWSSGHAWVNRIIEGWEVNTIQRWQSGAPFQLSSGLGGTFNAFDGGVNLVGMSATQVQDALEIRKSPDRRIFYFPASLLDSAQQRANENVLAPCRGARAATVTLPGTTTNVTQVTPTSDYGRFCPRQFFYGPGFYRADISIVKRTRITERVNVEYRAEFINAFNTINFIFPGTETTIGGGVTTQSTSLGRVTSAFRDISTTDDYGGRMVQMVLRLNF